MNEGNYAVVDELFAECDLIAFRTTEIDTHEGEFVGIEPTGKRVELTGNVVHRPEDGKVAETLVCFDMLGLLDQLGAVEMLR